MKRKGILVVISGPSGAGKGTVLTRAFAKNRKLRYSVSVTTRQPRAGEVDGISYFFESKENFLAMVAVGQFLEYQEVYGNFYGTPKRAVEDLLEAGYDVVLEIDVQGALNIKKNYCGAVLVFLTPSHIDEIRRRLVGRSTETEEQLAIRIAASLEEIKSIGEYDYVVINDEIDTCCNDFLDILKAEKLKVQRNKNFIDNIITEVNLL